MCGSSYFRRNLLLPAYSRSRKTGRSGSGIATPVWHESPLHSCSCPFCGCFSSGVSKAGADTLVGLSGCRRRPDVPALQCQASQKVGEAVGDGSRVSAHGVGAVPLPRMFRAILQAQAVRAGVGGSGAGGVMPVVNKVPTAPGRPDGLRHDSGLRLGRRGSRHAASRSAYIFLPMMA